MSEKAFVSSKPRCCTNEPRLRQAAVRQTALLSRLLCLRLTADKSPLSRPNLLVPIRFSHIIFSAARRIVPDTAE